MDLIVLKCKTINGDDLFVPASSLAAWVGKGPDTTRIFLKNAAGVNFELDESVQEFTARLQEAVNG